MDAKMRLAEEVISGFHGQAAAREASENLQRVVREKQLPQDIPVVSLKDEEWHQNFLFAGTKSVALSWLIATWKLAPSRAEAERLIKAGAVEFNDKRINNPAHQKPLVEFPNFTLLVRKPKLKKAVE